MTNLLHLVVSLVEDPSVRQRFRDDPEGAVADIDDLSGEDVIAVVDVARIQVDPADAVVLTAAMNVRAGVDDSPRAVAIGTLLAIAEAAEG